MMKKIIKILPLFILLGAGVWAKQSGFFERTEELLRGMGTWAMPAFFCMYVLSCLLLFPSVIMTGMAGILFPLPAAILLSLAGTAAGSTAALLAGRYALRPWLLQKTSGNMRFRKLDEAVSREGWKILTLARLAPVFPFSVGNYLFGATSVSPSAYASAAFLGTVPSACVYAAAGKLAGTSGPHTRTPAEWMLLAAGLAAVLFLSWYLKKFFDRIFIDSPQSRADRAV